MNRRDGRRIETQSEGRRGINSMTIWFAVFIFFVSCAREDRYSPDIRLSDRNEQLLSLFEEFNSPRRDMFQEDLSTDAEYQASLKKSETKSTAKLLRELKEDPYFFGRGPIGRTLAARGKYAAEELIEEVRKAEDYYLCSLATILADIPSNQRDRAFLAKLRTEQSRPQDYLRDDYIPPMMIALAVNQVESATPVLQAFARRVGEDAVIVASAGIALSILGHPEPLGPAGLSYTIASDAFGPDSDREIDAQLELLTALLRHGLLAFSRTVPSSGIFEITQVHGQGETTTLSGILPSKAGTWSLEIGKADEGRVPVFYEWHTGKLAAGGEASVLEMLDEEWRPIFWKRIWIS